MSLFGAEKNNNNPGLMKHHREFEIAWLGLKDGEHVFQYEVNDQILEDLGYEHPDFEQLHAKIGLKFDKNNRFFLLNFDIDGTAHVTCDRCGDTYPLKLWEEFKLIVKLTEHTGRAEKENEEEEADVVFMPRSETVMDISGWVFEFIMLSLPIQKIHPDNPDGSSGCNPEALKLLEKMSAAEHEAQNVWKGLEQFKNKESKDENTH
jgi:uncharacterized metal-binding protein YceD (DUF177 family)